MDTKWKSRGLLFTWLFLVTFGVSSIFVALNQGNQYLSTSYFQTQQFEEDLYHFTGLLSVYELNAVSKDETIKSIEVTQEEIEEYRYRYGNLSEQITSIKQQYDYDIEEAKAAGNKEVADVLSAERDKKIQDITKNFSSDEHIREKIIEDKKKQIVEDYRNLDRNRAEFENDQGTFKYFLTDINTGKIHTNMGIKNEEELSDVELAYTRSYPRDNGYLYVQEDYYDYMGFDETLIDKKAGPFKGVIGVQKAQGSKYNNYYKEQALFFGYVILGLISLCVSPFLYRKKEIKQYLLNEKWQRIYYCFPLEVKIAFIIATGIGLLTSLFIVNQSFYLDGGIQILEILFFTMIAAALLGVAIIQGIFSIKRYREYSNIVVDWKKSLLYKMFNLVKEAFLIRKLGTQVLILLTVVFFWGIGTAILLFVPEGVLVIIYILAVTSIGIPVIVFLMRQVSYLNKIIINTTELANGYLGPDLPVKGKSILSKHASHINTLKHGVKTSQREQAKSDRLKTELVTNISHDLRTPLTSIISYTDLLKKPDLSEDDRNTYIQIIDRKADRLKVLIEDLFEVSKMASGNMELEKDKVDLVQLLQQALGEFSETINQSSLDFRINLPDTPVYSVVDGPKIWRVFDNLIGNVIKYSLENTRIYISLMESNHDVEIIFKNVTKYELSEDVNELFERFKRGDTSRQTEGSGLGLAIAKSIVDIHGGKLDIQVDGDLFKVIVVLGK